MLLMQWIAAVFVPEREKSTDRKLVTVAMLFTEAARPKCLYKN
jgi:hypothetical protein